MNQHDVTVAPYYQIITEYFQEMGIVHHLLKGVHPFMP